MEERSAAQWKILRTGWNQRKSWWIQRFKSLFLKQVLPLKRLNCLCSRLNSLPDETAIPDRILEVLGLTYEISGNDLAKTFLRKAPWWLWPTIPLAQFEGTYFRLDSFKEKKRHQSHGQFFTGRPGSSAKLN